MKKGAPLKYFLLLLPFRFFLFYGFPVVNAAPVLSNIESKALEYTVGSGSVTITQSITVQSETRYLGSAIIRISEGYNPSEDILTYNKTGTISAKWDASTGTLTLTGLARASTYQTELRKVKFGNTNNTNPSTENRIISFTVTDYFGNPSNTVHRTIKIISLNSAPRLFNMETDPGIYCMNTEGMAITSTLSVEDASDLQLESAQVKITTGYHQDEDLLEFSNQNGITGSWNNSTGTLTLSGASLVSDYQAALRSVTYRNQNSGDPSALYHEITFMVNDGKANSNAISRGITHIVPTAVVSGNDNICVGEEAVLTFAFTGNSPWSISYSLSGGTPVTRENITSNPVNISVDEGGTYTLTRMTDRYCEGRVSGSAVIGLLPQPDVSLFGLQPVYSRQSTEWIKLQGLPEGGDYSGPGVLPYEDNWYFIPALPEAGVHDIIYKYRSSPESCYGFDTVSVRVLEYSSAIEIQENRTRFCKSDLPFKVTGINLISQEAGRFSISGGVGLVDHGDNTATVYPAQLEISHYTITYLSSDGISVNHEIDIGASLEAGFEWNTECFQTGELVTFNNTSVSPFGQFDEDSFTWIISGDKDTFTSQVRDYVGSFTEPGLYKVSLSIVNSFGCRETADKDFPLREVVALAGQNYFENFENSTSWHPQNPDDMPVNSWRFGSSPDHEAPGNQTNYWYTDITTNPAPPEHSWIASPCFDFTGVSKPTLVALIKRSFVDNRDGSNIEYTTDNGITWEPVGSIFAGINWYNSYFGIPGAQTEGWASIKDTEWVESRHMLDFLTNQKKVQFRVNYYAFGSAIGNEGIAIDDIRIVERNRTVLIEHFTNTSDMDCAEADSMLNQVLRQTGTHVLDIRYHTGDENDPFFASNKVIPSTRQFYYGLTGVPFSIINGGTFNRQRLDYNLLKPDNKQLNIESLYDSDFTLQVVTMLQGDTLYVESFITSLTDVPLLEMSLRMAVIEPVVEWFTGQNGRSVFLNVVKDMLPDAAGTVFYKPWSKGESISVRYAWPVRSSHDTQSLRVTAFLQNELTYEVFQAATDSRGIVSADDDPSDNHDPFSIYPNPANDRVFININRENIGNLKVELLNTAGIVMQQQTWSGPDQQMELNVRMLPEGFYLIRLLKNETVAGYGKLVISR